MDTITRQLLAAKFQSWSNNSKFTQDQLKIRAKRHILRAINSAPSTFNKEKTLKVALNYAITEIRNIKNK